MSNRTLMLKIDPWDEGPVFKPVVNQPQWRLIDLDEPAPSETLKPVGFYVAYSYILFRRRNDSADSLYAFF